MNLRFEKSVLNPDLSICYSLETCNYHEYHPVVKLKCCVGCSVSVIIGEADYLVQSFCGMCDIIYADMQVMLEAMGIPRAILPQILITLGTA